MAPIRNVILLPQPVRLDQVRRTLPDWGYLRNVRVGATIPVKLNASFEEALHFVGHDLTNHSAELSDLEGAQTEMKLLVRGRSRLLRNAAMERSGGICSVCERDFSKLLAGRGVRVLQVHHLKQLSATDRPTITSLKDLTVLCSNCHLLIHLDPKRALSVAELKGMLARSPPGPPQ
jgi:predicted HNH restriction endonuclease